MIRRFAANECRSLVGLLYVAAAEFMDEHPASGLEFVGFRLWVEAERLGGPPTCNSDYKGQ